MEAEQYLSDGEGKNIWFKNHSLLYGKEQFSDFELRCSDRMFKVHKIILASQSPVLKKVCFGHFRESQQGFMDMPDDDPKDVDLLLRAMYGLNYDDSANINGQPINSFLFNIRIYLISDKYDVQAVRAISKHKFAHQISFGPDTEELWDAMAESVRFIYGSTNPALQGLKAVMLRRLSENFFYFCKNQHCMALLRGENRITEFSADLFARLLLHFSSRVYCGVCGVDLGFYCSTARQFASKEDFFCPICQAPCMTACSVSEDDEEFGHYQSDLGSSN